MTELIIFAMGIVVGGLVVNMLHNLNSEPKVSGSIVVAEYEDQSPEMYLEIGVPYEEFKQHKEVTLKVVHKHFYNKANNRKK